MLKSFFDPNGAFARGMERVWSLIVLNVLWLVCSLPVVTMGASCAALYQVLGKLIAGEDKKKPLSDQKLCELMSREGCELSRRTVAKYRDELGIPSTTGRKQYE